MLLISNFSSTTKLRFWSERIKNIESNPEPIHLVAAVTQKCNLNCSFCYLFEKGDEELDIVQLELFIQGLPSLKSIEITGGEPTLYPYLERLINFCHKRGLRIGMTTNGIELNQIYPLHKLDWIRISINSYIHEGRKPDWDIPESVYYGYNYVYCGGPVFPTQFINFMNYYGGSYIRMALNRLATKEVREEYFKYQKFCQEYEKQNIHFRPMLRADPYHGKCYMGYLKPLLEPNGKVYNCVSELESRGHTSPTYLTDILHPEWLLMYHEDRVMSCRFCYYNESNNYIKTFLKEKHKEFI